MIDRTKLEALVWRRVPATLKVATCGTRLVLDPTARALRPMHDMSDADLFAVLRRASLPTKEIA